MQKGLVLIKLEPMIKTTVTTTWILIALFGLLAAAVALDLQKEQNLQGKWRFEIGDNLDYADPRHNDSRWELLNVPSSWEDEGFPGYDGYGWYRIEFELPSQLRRKMLYLKLGQIDDVDRTYINGQFVGGHGDFPPRYRTAYDVGRIYELPSNFLNFGGKNVLAVRVFDMQGVGGITYGDIGIYSREDVLDLAIDLSGMWHFKTGDRMEWADPAFEDRKWKQIAVPLTWEQQGYPRHDGLAWYRKEFKVSRSLAREKLILMLGKIDDIDQVFFNGVKIGETGTFPIRVKDIKNEYNKERAYFIPPYLINLNGTNVVSIRVFDRGGKGGMYSGYIGIATRAAYMKYQKKKK